MFDEDQDKFELTIVGNC